MGMSMQFVKVNTRPVLTCDECWQSIKNPGQALVTFSYPDDNHVSAITGIYHKVSCDPVRGPNAKLWEQLDIYVARMLWNNGFGKRIISGNQRQIVIDIPADDDCV